MNTNETCNRFEREGILRIERGLSLDANFDHCPACENAAKKYETLLARVPSPPPGASPAPRWSHATTHSADGGRDTRR